MLSLDQLEDCLEAVNELITATQFLHDNVIPENEKEMVADEIGHFKRLANTLRKEIGLT